MSKTRPAVADRWEFHLASGLLSVLVMVLQSRARRQDTLHPGVDDPRVRAWLAGRRDDAQPPWTTTLAAERTVLRALTSAWLAGRAYQLERHHRRNLG